MDRPLIFSAPMILALLAGRKSQTRPLLKPQPWLSMSKKWTWEPPGRRIYACVWHDGPPYIPITDALAMDHVPCAIGDRIWVKEAFTDDLKIFYRASEPANDRIKWRSPIFMPRWASRLTLEVTGVKVERVQDISEEDAIAEGIDIKQHMFDGKVCTSSPVMVFSDIWNSLHGPGAWDANSWVYAISFKTHKCNIDALRLTDR